MRPSCPASGEQFKQARAVPLSRRIGLLIKRHFRKSLPSPLLHSGIGRLGQGGAKNRAGACAWISKIRVPAIIHLVIGTPASCKSGIIRARARASRGPSYRRKYSRKKGRYGQLGRQPDNYAYRRRRPAAVDKTNGALFRAGGRDCVYHGANPSKRESPTIRSARRVL